MAFELRLAIKGDLRKMMALEAKAATGAVTTVIRGRTTRLKTALRKQVVSAGMGQRLANAWRSKTTPREPSVTMTGTVFSNAIVKRAGGLVDLFTVFDEGATIRAPTGKALAAPLPAAGRVGKRRATPADFAGKLTFIPSRVFGFVGVLIGNGQVLFVLLRQVTLRKRLNVDAAFQKAQDGLEEAIVREWEKRANKSGLDVAA